MESEIPLLRLGVVVGNVKNENETIAGNDPKPK